MSIVVGLHLQSDRVHATICRDHPNTGSAPRVEPFRTFPAALRWRSQASPALADHRVDGVYRRFVDRLGDPRAMSVPGGPDRLADQLTAALLTEIVRTIERSLGQHVDRVLIAHPAYWTVPQVHLMHYSLVDTGIDRHRALLLVPDTDAALEWIDHTAGLADAHEVTICDLREDSAVIGYARRPIRDISPPPRPTGSPVSDYTTSTTCCSIASWPKRSAGSSGPASSGAARTGTRPLRRGANHVARHRHPDDRRHPVRRRPRTSRHRADPRRPVCPRPATGGRDGAGDGPPRRPRPCGAHRRGPHLSVAARHRRTRVRGRRA